MKQTAIILFAFMLAATAAAQGLDPLYEKSDSIKIEKLLGEGFRQPAGTCLPLFYAKKFVGIPYVGATLEVSQRERLVVNLRQLDCTTLVETVTALVLTQHHGQRDFGSFCHWLQTIRYDNGTIRDYTSRNHYFSSFILNAERIKLAHEIVPADSGKSSLFTGTKRLDLHFMSRHYDRYPSLKKNPALIAGIKRTEKELTGNLVRYIPIKSLGKSKALKQAVHDGDILAIVTNRDGLDISHVGFAAWGKDGCLHLLNASSLHHKVVLETKTLQAYLRTQRLQPGIRVIRIAGCR